MTAYISLSYGLRKALDKELNAIIDVLNTFNIKSLVFVDNYKFDPAQERQMMQQATADIDNCDLLIAEVSEKGIGIGVEAGYARARNKPIVYIRQKKAAHSTTVSGISDFQIIYDDAGDLRKQLINIINQMIKILN
jgi:nucleoside 2-deoxyribosyltransferase